MMATGAQAHFLDDLKLALQRKGLGGLMRDVFLHPGNQAIALYRIYRWLYLRGHINLAFVGYRLNYLLCGVEIHPDADIGPDFHLDHPLSVLIHRRTRIGRGVRIYSHIALGAVGLPEENPFMDVRDYVQIYHGAMVGGSAIIGEYAQIGLNAVVWNQDVPPYSVVVGNPGRVIRVKGKKVDPKEYIGYKYDPSDFEGPPPEHDSSRPEIRKDSWTDPTTFSG
ncbi:MAG: serine O-acetyltransferase [Actinomycetota bacterium]